MRPRDGAFHSPGRVARKRLPGILNTVIVYGDPSYEATAGELLARLRARIAALRLGGAVTLDDLRALLIQTGQLEQAAQDDLPGDDSRPLRACLAALTDQAARVFHEEWDGSPPRHAALDDLARAADRAAAVGTLFLSCRLTVKVPEGFAFYALYPEQYVLAARRFMIAHAAIPRSERRAVVVGVRSIGTTLSAVVRAVLQAGGWRAHRLTVRPAGHPFARTTEVEPKEITGAAWGLIVDEGPGASGSSFAAVADTLARAGVPPARIVFLPAHAGEPGEAASDAVRATWARAPRISASRDELRWNGRALPDALAARTAELFGENVAAVEDLGGGLWRRVAYPNEADWPAANVPFERPKFRVTLQSGARVLWKFAGLAEVGTALGFVALPWIEGVSLSRADAADPNVLVRVGRHVARVAGPPLTPGEQHAARVRLRDLLYWNTWETLGEDAAFRARALADAVPGDADEGPSYGDGRMTPHEWLRTACGQIVKTDAGGHDADHTIIGRQPLAWDIAGALVEWGLENENAAAVLLAAVREAGAVVPAPAALRFYCLAYAAFRVGQTALCAQMISHDPRDQARLWRARYDYRAQLTRLLLDAAS